MMTEFSFLAGSSSLICRFVFVVRLITDRFGRCQRCSGPPWADRADDPSTVSRKPGPPTAAGASRHPGSQSETVRRMGPRNQASWGTENESPVSVRMSGKKTNIWLFFKVRYTEPQYSEPEQRKLYFSSELAVEIECDDTKITSSYRLSLLADSKIKQ